MSQLLISHPIECQHKGSPVVVGHLNRNYVYNLWLLKCLAIFGLCGFHLESRISPSSDTKRPSYPIITILLTPWLMDPGGSMLQSQRFSNNPYPEPNQSNSSVVTYFSTVLPSNICIFLSWRPFIVIKTLSTGLVGVEVTSVSWLGQLTVGV